MSHDCLLSLTEKGDFCISKVLSVFGQVTSYFFQKSSVCHFPTVTLISSMAPCPMVKRQWIWLSLGDVHSTIRTHSCRVQLRGTVIFRMLACRGTGTRPTYLVKVHYPRAAGQQCPTPTTKAASSQYPKPTHDFILREKESTDVAR